ncbi:hypothetical protein D3C87_1965400 [compost metagenome]
MPVDLQVVDGEVAEQLHLAVTDTEIVDGELEARLAHIGHQIGKFRYAGVVEAFGEFETDRRRRDLGRPQMVQHSFEEFMPLTDQSDIQIEKKRG